MILPDLDLWWLIPVAVALDFIAGDPRLPWPHPVRLIGRLLNYLEKEARKFPNQRLAGLACVALAAMGSGYLVYILISFPGLGIAAALYLSYAGLALGCLLREGRKVLETIENGSLDEARAALSMLVSRDVYVQDDKALRRSLADTLSENFTDAFIAPLFWLCFTGPAGLWAYKAVSTVDSMWGYKTEKWRELGFAGARLDDILAFIPARLSVLFIRMAMFSFGPLPEGGLWPGFSPVTNQASRMESPNSGFSMAAAAWLMGARMGGPTVYFGELKDKPWLGPEPDGAEWDGARLRALLRLLTHAALWGSGALYCSALTISILFF